MFRGDFSCVRYLYMLRCEYVKHLCASDEEMQVMKKYLIVVDMQKDFVNGSLGTKEAEVIVPAVLEKVKAFDGEVIFTKDTHFDNYLETSEGRLLPVEHCIKGTDGWMLIDELEEYCSDNDCKVYEKLTFGCKELAADIYADGNISIELIGLCTDICVVSNALLLKAFLPEAEIKVDASCCAGVTPKKHEAALETMRSCQIKVI